MLIEIILMAAVFCLAALSYYDFREGRLPNWLVACLAAAGGAHFFLGGTASPSATDIAVGLVIGPGVLLLVSVLFERLRGRPGLGLGDAKFMGAAALWVGASGVPVLFFVASSLTLLVIALLVYSERMSKIDLVARRIPFGPGLAAGLVAAFCLRYLALFP